MVSVSFGGIYVPTSGKKTYVNLVNFDTNILLLNLNPLRTRSPRV